MTALLAVPNVSEGRDRRTIDAIAAAFGPSLLDVHSDPDHNRSVFTLKGAPGTLARSVTDGARVAIARIDFNHHEGLHPRVGVLDVAPIVYLDEERRGAACAEALVLADLLGHELGIPVLLYGALAGGRTRAELRRPGAEHAPDFGPRAPHPTAGVTLLAARPPLVAFNVELAPPASAQDARRIAKAIREGGPEGLTGVRAIGLHLASRNLAQVSTNVEDHRATPLAKLVSAIAMHADILGTELVGLAPASAFDGFPPQIPVENKRVIEEVI